MLAMLPLYLALPWSIKWAKAFRAMPPPSVRSAELRPWREARLRFTAAHRPGISGAGLALVCSLLAYLHRPLLTTILALAVISGMLLLRMIYVLFSATGFGRLRADPYLSSADTFRSGVRLGSTVPERCSSPLEAVVIGQADPPRDVEILDRVEGSLSTARNRARPHRTGTRRPGLQRSSRRLALRGRRPKATRRARATVRGGGFGVSAPSDPRRARSTDDREVSDSTPELRRLPAYCPA